MIVVIQSIHSKLGMLVAFTQSDLCPLRFSILWKANPMIKNTYYMANPVLGKSLCSHWFFLGQDFAVQTLSMKMVQSMYFYFGAKPANSKFATETAKKKCENCHSSHWNYQQKPKRLKFFRNFTDGLRRQTFFKCKPAWVHFTIKNRVPCNKLLTNRACFGCTGEYWPSVVFVRTEHSEFRTVTTSGQYSLVRPSRSVSKR